MSLTERVQHAYQHAYYGFYDLRMLDERCFRIHHRKAPAARRSPKNSAGGAGWTYWAERDEAVGRGA